MWRSGRDSRDSPDQPQRDRDPADVSRAEQVTDVVGSPPLRLKFFLWGAEHVEQQTLRKHSHQSGNNFIRERLVNAWTLAERAHACARVHTYSTKNARMRTNGGKSSMSDEELRGKC